MKHICNWLLKPILKELQKIMSILDDILTAQATALSVATDNSNLLDAIKVVLDANTATINALQAQVAAAGNDPAKLQQVLDNMSEIVSRANSQKTAEAILAGTPAEPAPVDQPAPVDEPQPEPDAPAADAGAADTSGE